LRLRKTPEGARSQLIERPLAVADLMAERDPGHEFEFAAAIAAFGQLLREGDLVGEFRFDQVAALAAGAKGEDPDGYRAEFVELVEIARELSRRPGEG
jgi:Ca-activated chloride channel family protein